MYNINVWIFIPWIQPRRDLSFTGDMDRYVIDLQDKNKNFHAVFKQDKLCMDVFLALILLETANVTLRQSCLLV